MLKNRIALCAFGVALCAAAAPAVAGDGTNLTVMIPGDTQFVMVFNVADARGSSLLQKGYEKLLAAKPDAQAKMKELGIDPLKDVDTVLFAAGGVKSMEDLSKSGAMVVVIEGRLPEDKLAQMPGATSAKYQGVTIWSKEDTDAALIDHRLFFTKKGKMKAAIDVALGKGKGKGNNVDKSKKAAKLRDVLATTDKAAHIWGAILIPDKDKKNMGKDGITVDSVSGGMSFTADLSLSLRLNSNSEDAAKKAVAQINAALPQVTQGLGQVGMNKAAKSISVTQDVKSVKMSVTVTAAELQSLMGMMGGALGGSATGAPPPPATKSAPPATKKTP